MPPTYGVPGADELVTDRGDEHRPRRIGIEPQQDGAHRIIVPRGDHNRRARKITVSARQA
jgi:hypothetical protein